jgi:rod shape-determining protein MreC
MAWPPRKRGSSASRRDRNLALVRRVASAAVVMAGLLILVGSRIDPAQGGVLRAAALDVSAPVWRAARAPFDWIGRAGDYVGDYFFAVGRNRELEAQLLRHRRLEQHRAALLRENRQLKRLLGVVEPKRGWSRVLPIAGASSGSYVRSAIVSGGRGAGLRVGQPVRSPEGLVGRVVEVGSNASRVLLLGDASSRVPVRVERTGFPALVVGINAARLEVRYMAPTTDRLRVGDRLVTSGDGGIYPPDVPVGVVTTVAGEHVLARPYARAEALGYVLVEQPYLPPPAPVTAPASATPQPPALPSATRIVTPPPGTLPVAQPATAPAAAASAPAGTAPTVVAPMPAGIAPRTTAAAPAPSRPAANATQSGTVQPGTVQPSTAQPAATQAPPPTATR